MDPASKKHKADENGVATFESTSQLTPEDACKILEPFTTKQLLEILPDTAIHHFDVFGIISNTTVRMMLKLTH
ncbi:hypothetical protein MRB53_003215 [Persea americana]|uniref:Uncharacterized protein n=1 Tax=Persea americana TaxID=3435 RepID=A0ACC2MZ28_PERAE|nr:hypothetical protein MRB53_003215 [Persea americana]